MQIHLLKSKIHRATVTGGDVNYEGSLTISADLMEKCGLQEYEKILCGNMANGERFETYALPLARGSGEICVNGAAARLVQVGDLVIVTAFCWLEEAEARNYAGKVVMVDEKNRVSK